MIFNEQRARQLILEEFRTHPRACLFDYYKLLYQGTFGPEHSIHDEEDVRRILAEEFDSCEKFDQALWCDISYICSMFRVSLKVMSLGVVSLDGFARGFLDSARLKSPISREEWARHWEAAIILINKMALPVRYDRAEIARTLEAASLGVPVHHSDQYKNLYNPHYRLLTKEQFDSIFPFAH